MTDINASQEYWLRGPLAGVPDLLQPVAHALLQANDEIAAALQDFPDELLWEMPADVASVGFHLQHIAGVLDRLYTYASGNALSLQQLKYLSEEGMEAEDLTVSALLAHLDAQVKKSIAYLMQTDPATLTDVRSVGRQRLPSTVIGLLFHAAEHTMRHTGQLLVTSRIMIVE